MARFTRSRFRKKRQTLLDVPLTPLIDTALTLLVIFMIATPMIQNAVKITLPQGQAKEDGNAQQDLVVYVKKNDASQDVQIFFNGTELKESEVGDSIKKAMAGEQDRTVFVKADRSVSYGQVVELVDHIKAIGGIKYVALATQKRA